MYSHFLYRELIALLGLKCTAQVSGCMVSSVYKSKWGYGIL